jgi:uncharacterized protein YqhQ
MAIFITIIIGLLLFLAALFLCKKDAIKPLNFEVLDYNLDKRGIIDDSKWKEKLCGQLIILIACALVLCFSFKHIFTSVEIYLKNI